MTAQPPPPRDALLEEVARVIEDRWATHASATNLAAAILRIARPAIVEECAKEAEAYPFYNYGVTELLLTRIRALKGNAP